MRMTKHTSVNQSDGHLEQIANAEKSTTAFKRVSLDAYFNPAPNNVRTDPRA